MYRTPNLDIKMILTNPLRTFCGTDAGWAHNNIFNVYCYGQTRTTLW